MSRIQKGLIVSGFRVLCPGGTMVYSTCTLAPEENESVIAYLLEKFPEAGVMPVSIPGFRTQPAVTKWRSSTFDERVRNCVRVLPQDNDTAPFFIARITKRGVMKHRVEYKGKIESRSPEIRLFTEQYGVSPARFRAYSIVQGRDTSYITTPEAYAFWELRSFRKGLETGRIYNKILKPDNDFVQLFGRDARKNVVDLKEYQVQKYLKGDPVKAGSIPHIDHEFVILKYKGLPFGTGRYKGNTIRSAVKRDRRVPS
jgi:NOL1/NOP2/fmu family ribosome biogenesis protein